MFHMRTVRTLSGILKEHCPVGQLGVPSHSYCRSCQQAAQNRYRLVLSCKTFDDGGERATEGTGKI